jgi:hypothetical protein
MKIRQITKGGHANLFACPQIANPQILGLIANPQIYLESQSANPQICRKKAVFLIEIDFG